MNSIYCALAAAERDRTPIVLITVVRTTGSAPRHMGAKMLVYADGRTMDTIGGGELERRAVAAARAALTSGAPACHYYVLADPGAGGVGVCGGTVELFVEPIIPPAAD